MREEQKKTNRFIGFEPMVKYGAEHNIVISHFDITLSVSLSVGRCNLFAFSFF